MIDSPHLLVHKIFNSCIHVCQCISNWPQLNWYSVHVIIQVQKGSLKLLQVFIVLSVTIKLILMLGLFKDICANCFCTSLLRMNFTRHAMHWVCALSSNNNKKLAIAVTLRWFNDLGCLVTPIFLSLGRFLYRFSMFCKKWKNISSGSLNLLQNAPSYSIHLTSLFSCVAVSNASLRVKACENDGNIWNY